MDEIVEHAWIISIVGHFRPCSALTGQPVQYCSPQGKRRRLLSEDGTTSQKKRAFKTEQ